MTDKRSRGRPIGSGKKDKPFLDMVADLVITGLKPTTAMKRVVATRKDWDGASDTAVIRRWQVKWKSDAGALLAAANKRRELKPAAVVGGPVGAYAPGGTVSGFSAESGLEWFDRHLQEMQRITDMVNPPYLRALRQFEENERRMRDLIDPLYMRISRQMEEQQKRIDDLINPPWLRAHRQMEERMRQLDPFYHMSPITKAALGMR